MPEMTLPTLEIPAEYLDDMRSALITEVCESAARCNLAETELRNETRRTRLPIQVGDRNGAISVLLEDVTMLNQIQAGHSLTGTAAELVHVLDTASRTWAERLNQAYSYAPAAVDEVQPLLDRLRWAVEQTGTLATAIHV